MRRQIIKSLALAAIMGAAMLFSSSAFAEKDGIDPSSQEGFPSMRVMIGAAASTAIGSYAIGGSLGGEDGALIGGVFGGLAAISVSLVAAECHMAFKAAKKLKK